MPEVRWLTLTSASQAYWPLAQPASSSSHHPSGILFLLPPRILNGVSSKEKAINVDRRTNAPDATSTDNVFSVDIRRATFVAITAPANMSS